MEKFLSRKFLISAFIIIVSTVALFTGYINESTWTTVSALITALYGGSNLGQRHIEKRRDEAHRAPNDDDTGREA